MFLLTAALSILLICLVISPVGLCLVKTWSSRLVARWSRANAGYLVPDGRGDPWSALEIIKQHVTLDAAMVVERGCEQLRCRVDWQP